jgi:two-component system, NarL family, sensor histidine kinase UhpB
MKKIMPVLVCLCCFTALCYGQDTKIDSLQKVLQTSEYDTVKVHALIELAYETADNNPDTAIYICNQALTLATEVNYKMGIANAHNTMGIILIYLGRYEEAIKTSIDAIALYDEMLISMKSAHKTKILKQEGDAYNHIGFIYLIQNNYQEGLKNFSTSIKTYQEIGDTNACANPLLNIGMLYYQAGKYPEALNNFLVALKIYEKTGNMKGMSGAYNEVGSVYMNMFSYEEALKNFYAALKINEEMDNKREVAGNLGNIGSVYLMQNNMTKAIETQLAALKISEEIGNKEIMRHCLNEIGSAYQKQGNYTEAMKNHFAALKISEESGEEDHMAFCFKYIGIDYLKLKNYSESSNYLYKGLSIAKEFNDLLLITEFYRGLAELDSSQGKFKQSLVNYKLYITYNDSLVNQEKENKITQIQMQYEFDKKEALAQNEQEEKDALALKELQRQKLIRDFALGTIGLVLILFFFIYRSYRARQALRLNDIRNRIAGDLHDDIGSTLNSISIYSEVARKKDADHDEALEMIGDASRKIIDAMSDIVWTINAENDSFEKIIFRMKSLAYNLFRAKKIEFTFHSDESLNEKKLSLEERRNFYLIFKEAVNNLVKYSKATRAAITLTNESNRIRLHIQDNGIGFDTSQDNAGNGLKNMKRRADEMNAGFKLESQPGSGTQIELILKV